MIATYKVIYDQEEDGTSVAIEEDSDGLRLIYIKSDKDHVGDGIYFSMALDAGEAFANGILRAIDFIKESQK